MSGFLGIIGLIRELLNLVGRIDATAANDFHELVDIVEAGIRAGVRPATLAIRIRPYLPEIIAAREAADKLEQERFGD